MEAFFVSSSCICSLQTEVIDASAVLSQEKKTLVIGTRGWSGTGYGFQGNYGIVWANYLSFQFQMNKKGRLIYEFEVNFKKSFIWRSNLDLDIFPWRPGLKTGVKNAMFWSQIGEPAAHSHQKFPGVFPKGNSAFFSYKISFYSQVSNSETDGKVACRNKRHRCPATSCARPRVEKGQCCASCPDGKKLDSRAHYAGAFTILFLAC